MRKSTYVKTTRHIIIEKTVDSNTLFKLTRNYQMSKRCKDGKRRSFFLYFLNNILILKQKRPFDEYGEPGYGKIYLENIYLFAGNIFQERRKNHNDVTPRLVRYPISKRKLESLNVPPYLKICVSEFKTSHED